MQWAKEGARGAKARPYGVLQDTVKVYGHEKPQKVSCKGVTDLTQVLKNPSGFIYRNDWRGLMVKNKEGAFQELRQELMADCTEYYSR